MRYLYFLLRYSCLILYVKWARATCAFDETARAARCFSFADTKKLFSRAKDVANLEVECLMFENTTFSVPFPNLHALSIHGCGMASSDLDMPMHSIHSLNLSNNDITNLAWQKLQGSASDFLDLRQNPLSCEDCTNLWIWEHQRQIPKLSAWDLHFVVGLPKQILTDDKFLQCNFSHCPHEEVRAHPLTSKLELGGSAHLSCDVTGFAAPSEKEEVKVNGTRHFIWPLRDEHDYNNSTAVKMEESWDAIKGRIELNISSLTSNELGYVVCICQHCQYRPAFDVLELRFETNLSVSLEEDERDNHLIVHGNPIDDLNITITRIADNVTETKVLSRKKTSFFNDSLLLRFQQEHSHFFVRYYSLIIQECILCPPRLSTHIDGDYLIEVCRMSVGDCAIAEGYLDHPTYERVKKDPIDESKDRGRQHLILITIFLILLIIGLLIALSKTHIKHRLLKKGWELKRRRTSRNTDRTEETSIRLDDYSASSSLNYIVQHVPLIDKELLHVKEKIGKGAFGEVHLAEWNEKERTVVVAMKMLHGIQLDSELDREAALLAQLDHPNIVKLYGISRWDNQIALIMEMMDLGDLKTYVRQRMPRCDNYSQFPAPLLTTELLNIAAQVAAGLCYLTSQQIIHRDLAARNCLVQGESDMKCCNAAFRKPIAVKISDFGMSRRLYSDGEYYKMQNKTALPVRWIAPECLSSGKFTHQSDIWSFGMTLFELFSYGDVPFGDLSNNEVLTAVISGMKPQLPSSFPEPINNLISQCWRSVPEERITATEALNRLQIIQ